MKNFLWFENLFGFPETKQEGHGLHPSSSSSQEIQDYFDLSPHHNNNNANARNNNNNANNITMTSRSNGRTFHLGQFTRPTLQGIRSLALDALNQPHCPAALTLRVSHVIVGDVLAEHHRYPLATFQAASQLNCLEFPNPKTLPEHGITAYSTDRTQGPACALACPAGTLYRNYFLPVYNPSIDDYEIGQRESLQVNNLDALEVALNNNEEQYWQVVNGYTFSTEEGLARLNQRLEAIEDHDALCDLVKIGWQRDTEVVFQDRFVEVERREEEPVLVSQVYCSALSVAYSGIAQRHWEAFARLVLEANYEATIWAAILNMIHHHPDLRHVNNHQTDLHNHLQTSHQDNDDEQEHHLRDYTSLPTCSPHPPSSSRSDGRDSDKLFLTLLGGGVFGNALEWIVESMARACIKVDKELKRIMKQRKHLPGHGTSPPAVLYVHVTHFRELNRSVAVSLTRLLDPELTLHRYY